ncbi:MAG: hypothetical protein DSY77_17475 [Bacteroidetes bacterium]|nr:MAG: hypothetical protein DSY77_17475 [Bacteroidota bacterium]
MKITKQEQIERIEAIEKHMKTVEEGIKGLEAVDCDRTLDSDGMFTDTLTILKLRFETFKELTEIKIDSVYPEKIASVD